MEAVWLKTATLDWNVGLVKAQQHQTIIKPSQYADTTTFDWILNVSQLNTL